MEVSLRSPGFLIAVLATMAAIVGICSTPIGAYLPVLLLGLAYCVWSFPRPAFAVATVILLNASVLQASSEITPLEIAIGLYLYGFLGYWFLVRFFVKREPFLTRTPDYFLLAFILVCVLSVIMLFATGSRIDYWFRECLTLFSFLLIFPAREAMRSERGLVVIVGAFVLLVLTLGIMNIVEYRASTVAANYLWEVWSGRKPFGSALYMGATVGAISALVHLTGKTNRALALLFAAVAIVALGTTYYRGFWIGALLGCVVLFLLLPSRGKVRLFWYGLIGTGAAMLLITVIAGGLADAVFRAVAARIASSGNALEDISIANRIAETRTVLSLVPQSPLVGLGYGAWFHHFNIITQTTEVVHYVHNVYVYLLMKVGAIGLFLFVGYLVSVIAAGVRVSRGALERPLVLALVRASVALYIGFMFVGTNSGILEDKQVLLVLTLGAAFITSRKEV